MSDTAFMHSQSDKDDTLFTEADVMAFVSLDNDSCPGHSHHVAAAPTSTASNPVDDIIADFDTEMGDWLNTVITHREEASFESLLNLAEATRNTGFSIDSLDDALFPPAAGTSDAASFLLPASWVLGQSSSKRGPLGSTPAMRINASDPTLPALEIDHDDRLFGDLDHASSMDLVNFDNASFDLPLTPPPSPMELGAWSDVSSSSNSTSDNDSSTTTPDDGSSSTRPTRARRPVSKFIPDALPPSRQPVYYKITKSSGRGVPSRKSKSKTDKATIAVAAAAAFATAKQVNSATAPFSREFIPGYTARKPEGASAAARNYFIATTTDGEELIPRSADLRGFDRSLKQLYSSKNAKSPKFFNYSPNHFITKLK